MTREELYEDFYPYVASQLRWLMDVLDSDLSEEVRRKKSATPYTDAYHCLSHYMHILTILQRTMDDLFDGILASAEKAPAQVKVLQDQLGEFRALLRAVKYP